MESILTKIVTPQFVAFQAHCWFAYAVVFTFFNPWVIGAVIIGAGIKEFYVDKHFEVAQTFVDNLIDYSGYLTGIGVAACATHFL
jgi:hypothetical protein